MLHLIKKKKRKDKKEPKVNQKWSDLNLIKMRKYLINYGKMFSKYPKDPNIRNHFYKLQREYNKTRKRKYKKSLFNRLEILHSNNPKLYWNLINENKESKTVKKRALQLTHQLGYLISGIEVK